MVVEPYPNGRQGELLMSISPSAPEPKESYSYEAASTPRWIFVVFIAAFVLIGYLLYAGNDARTKLESELSKSDSKQAVLAAQIEQTNSVVADLRGKLEVTTQKLGFTQAELGKTFASHKRKATKNSRHRLARPSKRLTQKSGKSAQI
jgi:hypothetical protein